ncbi:phosphatase PAP2 family protein [Micromonospora lupini]|uniref:phosphatase PAP2 family protein n=1 Tax=Micromonospora lupini TaxID=285679 RepID=UPI0022570874|nr:phosphatase PAP2 family protein [Micromonospora lupini]MCX5070812.1 phosphatase PAP2 family protein [Micromonospora lupini]
MSVQADTSTPTSTAGRTAHLVTEVLQPAVWAAIMPVVVALVASPTLTAGAGWGALAALFSAVIPFGAILYAKRTGRVTDHHISQREQRKGVLLVGIASVLASLVLFLLLGAPRPLIAMIAVMLVVLGVSTAINQAWKLSAHSAVSAGSFAVLALLIGPGFAAGVLVVALIGWSRVYLRAHTIAQVVAGAVLGAALAAAVYAAIA